MANDQSLDRLKAKYQSVLNQMEKLAVQLKNVHLDQGKLVIRIRCTNRRLVRKKFEMQHVAHVCARKMGIACGGLAGQRAKRR